MTKPEHQCRFRPAPTTSAGMPTVYWRFSCRCGAVTTITPGLRVADWRWKWLSDNGIRREWKKRAKTPGVRS